MSILSEFKKAIEACMPDLRHYYRITKKARVVKVYEADGQFYCDVQPLRNDESTDEKEPIVPKITLPVIWGGKNRGVVCPPCIGVLCDLSYYDGDPNYPFISNIRWDSKTPTPKAKLNEFVIQLENGVEIRIDAEKNIIALTPANWKVAVGGNASIDAGGNIIAKAIGDISAIAGGNITATAGGNANIQATSSITISAPQINQIGSIASSGVGGAIGTTIENTNRTQTGNLILNGNITVSGAITASSAKFSENCHAGSRSGGVCPHTC